MSVEVIDLAAAGAAGLGSETTGAKAAGLVTLDSLGLPVPPAFVITTDAGRRALRSGGLDADLRAAIRTGVADLERSIGRRFGDPGAPLLLAVRSGAAVSMPGMLDTVLDLGALDPADHLPGGADEAFLADTRRRFLRSYATVVSGLDADRFDAVDAEVADPHERVRRYGEVIAAAGASIPADPYEQLERAVAAVLASWDHPRARAYRDLHGLDHAAGTAVTVQAMVFGNRDPASASGVAFSRDPATGAPTPYGDVLVASQGDDVVAGRIATAPLDALAARLPQVWEQLLDALDRLERHVQDLVMVEFTVEAGTLWFLQLRAGGATDAAAVRIAVDLVDRGVIDHAQAVRRTTADHLRACVPAGPQPSRPHRLTRGLAASPGTATGTIAVTAEQAVDLADAGPVVLVRPVTSPADVRGMGAAAGILTASGGVASHAAIVARAMRRPAVVGAADLDVDVGAGTVTVGREVLRAGVDVVSIDGRTGEVIRGGFDEASPAPAGRPRHLERLLRWADTFAGTVAPAATDEERLAAARRALDAGPSTG